MQAWKRVAPPALAAALIVVGLLVLDWAHLEGALGLTIRLTPLGNELCGAICLKQSGYGVWTMLGYLMLVLGGLAALGLTALTVLRALSAETRPLDRTIGWLCSTLAATAGCGMLATGGGLDELAAGGPVTLAGAILGLVSRLGSSEGAFAGGRSARPIRSTATVGTPTAAADPYREAAIPPPTTARAPRSQPADLDTGPRPATAPPANPRLVRPSPTAPVAADATRGALRFVVSDATLTADGLIVRFDRGAPRTIPWTSVTEIAARRMPPDPPYDKTAFVDLVLGDGPPARLLPTTRLDLAALPAGIAPNTKENWRRLVAHARNHNPAIAIEADSADFFAGGRDPLMFPALKKFAEWDRRYG